MTINPLQCQTPNTIHISHLYHPSAMYQQTHISNTISVLPQYMTNNPLQYQTPNTIHIPQLYPPSAMYQQTHISNTIFACDKLIKRPPIQRDTLLSEFGACENPLINTSCEIERRITIGFGESRDGNGIEW